MATSKFLLTPRDPLEQRRSIKTSVQALLADLKACSRARNLERGKQCHAEAVECGHDSNVWVLNALVNMYVKCGSMSDAHRVFLGMKNPNVVSWTMLILGYADTGQGLAALDLFARMKAGGPPPDSIAFVAALKACTALEVNAGASAWAECRQQGKEIHELAVKSGYASDVYLQNTLIDMYTKFGSMVDAHKIFNSMKQPTVVSWTALILGYAENGEGLAALHLFARMGSEGPAPNSVTFVAALKACTSHAMKVGTSGWAECCNRGKQMHNLAMENDCISYVNVQNTLIDMYAKCGSMEDARQVFDSVKVPTVVSWTALILGYAENGQDIDALDLFTRMKSGGPPPDSVTLIAALKACTSLAASGWPECRDRCKEIHAMAMENGCASDMFLQSTLIDMYAKCGSMPDARRVFDGLKHPDVVSWNVVILGYAENGQGLTAMNLFSRMKCGGPAPDSVTFLACLKACSLVGGLDFGRAIHSEMGRGNHLEVFLVNGLVDFYARCGSLVEAQRVFDLHADTRNVVTWTSLLAGFSSRGDHGSVFELFERMQDAGVQPVAVTFVSLLACCSHAGLVEKGKEYFDAMSEYRIIPTIEHYTCMVDIFGRANKLDRAMALWNDMPCSSDDVIWTTILGACRKWKNVDVGRLAFQSLIHFNTRDAAAYVLMGQLYGSIGMLQEQDMVLRMRNTGAQMAFT